MDKNYTKEQHDLPVSSERLRCLLLVATEELAEIQNESLRSKDIFSFLTEKLAEIKKEVAERKKESLELKQSIRYLENSCINF
jgi:hypothetical protein